MVVVIFNHPVPDGFTVARDKRGTSLTAQWLRLQAFNAGGLGLIPGWGNKGPHAAWRGQNNKQTKKVPNKTTTTTKP